MPFYNEKYALRQSLSDNSNELRTKARDYATQAAIEAVRKTAMGQGSLTDNVAIAIQETVEKVCKAGVQQWAEDNKVLIGASVAGLVGAGYGLRAITE